MRRVAWGVVVSLPLALSGCARCRPCGPCGPIAGGVAPAARAASASAEPKGVVDVEMVVLTSDSESRTATTVEVVDAAAATKMRASHKMTSGPRITVVEGQRANLTIANAVSYIDSFDIEKEGGATVANPIVGTAGEGLEVDVSASPAAGGAGRYEIDLAIRTRALARPIATESVDLGFGPPVVVQRPRVTLGGIETRLLVAHD